MAKKTENSVVTVAEKRLSRIEKSVRSEESVSRNNGPL
jgi:hypothetical protein